jgi:hypothetical protein
VIPAADRRRRLRELVGRGGRAVSELVPWGAVAIGEERFEAVSETGPLEAGTEVEIVGVQGGALVVRSAARAVEPEPLRPAAAEKPDSAGPERLSRTLEEFEFEQLNRPEP